MYFFEGDERIVVITVCGKVSLSTSIANDIAASVIPQRDGHIGGLAGGIEIGQHEVLLEAPPGVAFGKEPVGGELLHPDHIGAPETISEMPLPLVEVPRSPSTQRVTRVEAGLQPGIASQACPLLSKVVPHGSFPTGILKS